MNLIATQNEQERTNALTNSHQAGFIEGLKQGQAMGMQTALEEVGKMVAEHFSSGGPDYLALRRKIHAFRSSAIQPVSGEVHPDTVRLDHLIEQDHAVIRSFDLDEAGKVGTIEEVHFIVENRSGEVSPEEIRRAIDRSIAAQKLVEAAQEA